MRWLAAFEPKIAAHNFVLQGDAVEIPGRQREDGGARFFAKLAQLASASGGGYVLRMERLYHLHIERLPEGLFLATSEEIQGLVAQGRTVNETVEIARDVARKILETQEGAGAGLPLADSFDLPFVVPVEA